MDSYLLDIVFINHSPSLQSMQALLSTNAWPIRLVPVENRKAAITAAAIAGASLATLWFVRRLRRRSRLPPGPRGWPLIGNVELFKATGRDAVLGTIDRLAEKYGDMTTVKFGALSFVLVFDPKLVQEGLLSKQLTNRFTGFYSLDYFTEGMNSIFAAPNSERWRFHRKSSYSAFRMFAQGERLEQFVVDSFDGVVKYFSGQESEYKDVYETVYLLVYNLQCRMTFSSEYTPDDPEFIWLRETMEFLNIGFQKGVIIDILPILRFLPFKSCRGFIDATDGLLSWAKKLCEKRKASFNPNELNDILDFLIQEQRQAIASGNGHLFQDVHLRQTLIDIFTAGTDTLAMTLYWVIWGLCSFPEMQERCYAEVNSVFGDSTPRMSERHRLPYTDAFLHEVMRFWPLGPLVPRECSEDCQLGGYQLPRGTQVMLSTYRSSFDPTAFPDPHTFKPEHFLTEKGELAPHKQGYMPFGAGTRVCLGESIAKKTTFLITTLLIQSFKFVQSSECKDFDGYGENASLLFGLPKRFKVRVVLRKAAC